MRKISLMAVAASSGAMAIAAIATPAFAQSTGSVEFEKVIVVTGAKGTSLSGVNIPETPKAKQVLDQAIISRQVPGQSINDIINLVPGVASFNNDPFGGAGSTLYIRGFDASRISETFDGIPLNDTGNYALYSQQQLDPELIENVNVNLGTTDVDSPTASATGSTINYRSLTPTEKAGARAVASVGDFGFMRMFGMLNTGVLNKSGTRAWLAGSASGNNAIYGGIGKVLRRQLNAKIYQPIGSNGDFIALAGHYNVNRNNFFASVPMWNENIGSRVVGSGSGNRYPLTSAEQFFQVARCTTTPGGAGAQTTSSSACGTAYEYRFNPSDTANIRLNSRFTLTDHMILTLDPYFTYTNANGGGTVTASEGTTTVNGTAVTGFVGGSYYFGRDLNGDGDKLDTVTLLAPSNTRTHRLGVIASLRYEFSPSQVVRLNYTYDRGRHRQTGELGYLLSNGFAADPFPINNPITDVNGNVVEKRNRLSYAILHKVSGEYSGKFFENKLNVTLGASMPFFKRNLNNYCFTTSATGNLNCFEDTAANTAYATANPTVQGPQQRIFTYSKFLPSAGLTFKITPQVSVFGNFSQGLQVPGTDNLYNYFYYSTSAGAAKAVAETSNNFDAGVRFRTSKVLLQVSGWYTQFNNRLASAYDRDLNATIYRNLGRVDKYGIDANMSWKPNDYLNFYVFGSYLKSKIKDNVDAGACTGTNALAIAVGALSCVNGQAFYQTAGKRESGAPVYTIGGRVDGHYGPVDLGVQVKRTGRRYVNDQNLPYYAAYGTSAGVLTAGQEIFPAATPGFTLVDLSARVKMGWAGLNDTTYFQFNVQNVFNEFYVGGFSSTLAAANASSSATSYAAMSPVTYANLGTPRTFIASLNVQF